MKCGRLANVPSVRFKMLMWIVQGTYWIKLIDNEIQAKLGKYL